MKTITKLMKTNTKHKPNPNQTQTKPKPNPNQTQTKPKPTKHVDFTSILFQCIVSIAPFQASKLVNFGPWLQPQ